MTAKCQRLSSYNCVTHFRCENGKQWSGWWPPRPGPGPQSVLSGKYYNYHSKLYYNVYLELYNLTLLSVIAEWCQDGGQWQQWTGVVCWTGTRTPDQSQSDWCQWYSGHSAALLTRITCHQLQVTVSAQQEDPEQRRWCQDTWVPSESDQCQCEQCVWHQWTLGAAWHLWQCSRTQNSRYWVRYYWVCVKTQPFTSTARYSAATVTRNLPAHSITHANYSYSL